MAVLPNAYANAAAVITRLAAEFYTKPPLSPFLASGFLNSKNLNTNVAPSEIFGVPRTPKKTYQKMSVTDQVAAGFEKSKLSVAYSPFAKIRSVVEATNKNVEYLPKEIVVGLISADPLSMTTQFDQRIKAILNEHYAAVCEGIDATIMELITSDNWIKVDGDGAGRDGAQVTYAVDSGRTPVDFAASLDTINDSTAYAILAELGKALTGGPASTTTISLLRAGEPIFVFLPAPVYNQFVSAFSRHSKWEKSFGSDQTDGSGGRIYNPYFTANGYIFVSTPTEYFPTGTAGTVPAPVWVAPMLTPGSMAYGIPAIPLNTAVEFAGSNSAYDIISATFGIDSEMGGPANDRAGFLAFQDAVARNENDPLLMAYLSSMGVAGMAAHYPAAYNFYNKGPLTTAESEGVTIYAENEVVGVRARPHFIQTINFNQDLSPISLSAASASARRSAAAA